MLKKLLNKFKVKDLQKVLRKTPPAVRKEKPVDEMLYEMIRHDSGENAYVVDHNNRLIGSVRRSRVREMLAEVESNGNAESELTRLTVGDIMTAPPRFVYLDTGLQDAAGLLLKDKLNALPVVNRFTELVGEINFMEILTCYLKLKKDPKKAKTSPDPFGRLFIASKRAFGIR